MKNKILDQWFSFKRQYWMLKAKIFYRVKRANYFFYNCKVFLKRSMITFIVVSIVIPVIHNISITPGDNNNIQVSVGTAIGTMLALILTLSIIPIQKSSELWSAAITRLYKRDKRIFWAYFFISISTILTFVCAAMGKNFIFTGLIFLAITLDVLRWNYEYICDLLDPETVIKKIENFTIMTINRYVRSVKRFGKYAYNTLPKEQRVKISQEKMEIEAYQKNVPYNDDMNRCIDEITEIAKKSIIRSEFYLTKIAISSLSKMAIYYLNKRTNNLKINLSNDPLLYTKADDIFLRRVYEALSHISKTAIISNDENSAIYAGNGYINIIEFIVNAGEPIQRLSFTPVFYLREQIKNAQNKQIDEIVFRSTQSLLIAASQFSKDFNYQQTYQQIIDCYQESNIYLLFRGKLELSDHLAALLMQASINFFNKNSAFFIKILPYTLECIEIIVWYIIKGKVNITSVLRRSLLANIYDSYHSEINVTYFFVTLYDQIKGISNQEEKDHKYTYYLAVSEQLHEHFIRLSKECDFSDSILLQEIMSCIKFLMKNIVTLLKESVGSKFETSLLKEIKCYLLFFKLAFTKKESIDFQQVKSACDILTHLGMQFIELPFFADEVINLCIFYIKSLINIFCANGRVEHEKIVELLFFLVHLKLASEKNKLSFTVNEIDKILSTKIHDLNDEEWNKCLEQLKIKKHALDMAIDEGIDAVHIFRDSSEDLLIKILSKTLVDS